VLHAPPISFSIRRCTYPKFRERLRKFYERCLRERSAETSATVYRSTRCHMPEKFSFLLINCSDTSAMFRRLFKIHSNNMTFQRLIPKHHISRMCFEQTEDTPSMFQCYPLTLLSSFCISFARPAFPHCKGYVYTHT
jgi:hypothetical protein